LPFTSLAGRIVITHTRQPPALAAGGRQLMLLFRHSRLCKAIAIGADEAGVLTGSTSCM
jgi:hypothetical protein